MRTARLAAAVALGVVAGATISARGQCQDTLFFGRSLQTDQDAYTCVPWDPDAEGPAPQRLVVAGRFTSAGWYEHRVTTSACAAWDGRAWHAMPAPGGAVIYALATRGTELFACGRSLGLSGAATVARWDGSAWRPLPSAVDLAAGEAVLALAVHNGELIAAGTFSQIGGVQAPGAAAWDGATWRRLGTLPMHVHALTSHDGLLLAAGDRLQGPARSMAVWDGHDWQDLPGAPSGHVNCLLSSGPDLIVGGSFLVAGGSSARNIARWDGTVWHPLGAGLDVALGGGEVWSIAEWQGRVFASGNILVSGPTASASNLASWDGEVWTAPPFSRVGVLVPSSMCEMDGRLWLAGMTEGRSGVAMLGAPYEARIESQEATLGVCAGERARLMLRVSGTPPMTYQWRRSGVPIPGGTGQTNGPSDGDYSVLLTPPITEASVFDCVVTGLCGQATSAPFAVRAGPPDFDGDGVANLADVGRLVEAISGGEPCSGSPDVNQDGNADQDDIAAFVDWVLSGTCP